MWLQVAVLAAGVLVSPLLSGLRKRATAPTEDQAGSSKSGKSTCLPDGKGASGGGTCLTWQQTVVCGEHSSRSQVYQHM